MSTEQTQKCFVLTWGSYNEYTNRYLIDVETEIFIFETKSTAFEGMQEDLKSKLLGMMNLVLVAAKTSKQISMEKLVSVAGILEKNFNTIESTTSIEKANQIIDSIVESLRNIYEEDSSEEEIDLFSNITDFLTIYDSGLGIVSPGEYKIVEKVVDTISIPKDEKDILSRFDQFLFGNR